jgi:hypothetical protein
MGLSLVRDPQWSYHPFSGELASIKVPTLILWREGGDQFHPGEWSLMQVHVCGDKLIPYPRSSLPLSPPPPFPVTYARPVCATRFGFLALQLPGPRASTRPSRAPSWCCSLRTARVRLQQWALPWRGSPVPPPGPGSARSSRPSLGPRPNRPVSMAPGALAPPHRVGEVVKERQPPTKTGPPPQRETAMARPVPRCPCRALLVALVQAQWTRLHLLALKGNHERRTQIP